jgi:predicted DNA-binding protein (MmcQ/YjbR family)
LKIAAFSAACAPEQTNPIKHSEAGMTSKASILAYAKTNYDTNPDYPWGQDAGYAVLRHVKSKKWFCLVMTVKRQKIGLDGEGLIDVMNIKCRTEWIGALRQSKGFLPAYHMNKEHWLTVLLDGTVQQEHLCQLIDDSYALTQ